jgi:hypothetical protein
MAKKDTDTQSGEAVDQTTLAELQKKIQTLESTHEELMAEAGERIRVLEAQLAQAKQENIELEKAMKAQAMSQNYVNPDPRSPAGQKPRLRAPRPKRPTGNYVAKEPLEIATGNGGRMRIEAGHTLPDFVSDEVIGSLETDGKVEPEYSED